MGKTLVIAEKASAGRTIASFLGADARKDGYLEGGSWVVAWASGHVVDLGMPDEYKERDWSGWDADALPMIPEPDEWILRPAKDKNRRKQYATIKSLLSRPDIDRVVNACDPDREGEGIFRRVWNLCGCKKPLARIWAKSLAEEDLRTQFSALDLPKDRNYASLGEAALLRAKADWLIGMNASRLETMKARERRSIGRVRTPTLAFVVERDARIESFVPEEFFQVACDLGGFAVLSERIASRSDAEALSRACDGSDASLCKVETRKCTEKPPRLFSTTSIQKEASRIFGMKPVEVDAALQSLYESKLCTYPRTSSEYVTGEDLGDVKALILQTSAMPRFAAIAKATEAAGRNVSRVVDDAKVEGHTAILPTSKLDSSAYDSLPTAEQRVMALICVRLLQATASSRTYTKTEVEALIAGRTFKASFEAQGEAGWRAADADAATVLGVKQSSESARQPAPDGLAEGDVRKVLSAEVKDGKTSPPKPFTYDTLLEAMRTAGKSIEDADLKEALSGTDVHAAGIGTDATRARIIEELERLGYIKTEKKKLRSTELGRAVISSVPDELKSAEISAQMEQRLYAVEHGDLEPAACLAFIEDFVRAFSEKEKGGLEAPLKREEVVLGACPRCGGRVLDKGKVAACERQKSEKAPDGSWREAGSCDYKLFKTVAKRSLSNEEVSELLSGKKLALDGFVGKKGRFSAGLMLDSDGKTVFDFSR